MIDDERRGPPESLFSSRIRCVDELGLSTRSRRPDFHTNVERTTRKRQDEGPIHARGTAVARSRSSATPGTRDVRIAVCEFRIPRIRVRSSRTCRGIKDIAHSCCLFIPRRQRLGRRVSANGGIRRRSRRPCRRQGLGHRLTPLPATSPRATNGVEPRPPVARRPHVDVHPVTVGGGDFIGLRFQEA